MNSKLLEEAIIDAEALREAALKNAEQAILDKYAPEVKNAIETLLEQEAPMDPMMDPSMGQPQEEELDVPLAATDGEKLCPCPDDDEVITISIGDLEKAISDMARANKMPKEEPPPMDAGLGMDAGMDMGALPPEEEVPSEEEAPLAESIELDEEMLSSILEELESSEDEENKEGEEDEEDEEGAKETIEENKSLLTQNSKLLVERKKTLNENKLLTEKLTKLLEQHNKLLQENKQVKETAIKLSKRLDETNLMNAKLHYKNQALGSDSLNERQKMKIVEAVSQAGSVDEAKMIYETLCNAVGSFENKGPQSLSEAVETRSSFIMKARQQNNSVSSNPLFDKWQKIAGIKKDN